MVSPVKDDCIVLVLYRDDPLSFHDCDGFEMKRWAGTKRKYGMNDRAIANQCAIRFHLSVFLRFSNSKQGTTPLCNR